jgi:hypothetical protein
MSDHDDTTLLSVAEAITDGMTVDWAAIKQRNPALAEDLAVMEAMADVANAYDALRKPDRGLK